VWPGVSVPTVGVSGWGVRTERGDIYKKIMEKYGIFPSFFGDILPKYFALSYYIFPPVH
jgi:hypothetical protein